MQLDGVTKVRFSSQERYDEAIKCYDKAIKNHPNFPDARNDRADSFYKLKKYDEAIKCYDESLKLDQNNTHALNSKHSALKEKFDLID
jgi:tetratricopeptide (TPR) repeat protein